MTSNTTTLFLHAVLLFILCSFVSAAELDIDPANYADKNHNLDKKARLRMFHAMQKKLILKNPKPGDFDLDSELTPKAKRYIDDISEIDEEKFQSDAKKATGETMAEISVPNMVKYLNGDLYYQGGRTLGDKLTTKPPINTFGFQLRHSFNTDLADTTDIGDPTSPTKKASKEDFTKGALFSYTHDFAGSNNTWAVDGALLRPINLIPNQKAPVDGSAYLSRLDLVPSITFDRLSSNDPDTDQINSLVFRIGAVAEYFGTPVFDIMQFRGYVGQGTDFNFRSQVFVTEAEWEPIKLSLGLGIYKKMGVIPVYYALRFYLHAEYTDTLDTGDKPNLTEGSAGRFGPRIGLDFQPVYLHQLTLSCFYALDVAVPGSISNSQYFSVALNYDITDNFGIAAEYRNGEIPIARDKANSTNVGLTLKF